MYDVRRTFISKTNTNQKEICRATPGLKRKHVGIYMVWRYCCPPKLYPVSEANRYMRIFFRCAEDVLLISALMAGYFRHTNPGSAGTRAFGYPGTRTTYSE